MFKFLFRCVVWVILTALLISMFNRVSALNYILITSTLVVFVLPWIWKNIQTSMNRSKWQRDAEAQQAQRADEEEQAHQTSLRRERERLEMQQRVRISELITVMEVQSRADEAKLANLAKMKADMANRQNQDLTGLLARLEAMKF